MKVKEYHIQQYQLLLAEMTEDILRKIQHNSKTPLSTLNRFYAEKCFDLANADFEPVDAEELIGYEVKDI